VGIPESPAVTEVQQLIEQQQQIEAKLTSLTDAVNLLGGNVQWIIDNVKGIFEMFSNPQFMSMLPGMMGGVPDGGQGNFPDGGGNNPPE
jgi:hypothetical protein